LIVTSIWKVLSTRTGGIDWGGGDARRGSDAADEVGEIGAAEAEVLVEWEAILAGPAVPHPATSTTANTTMTSALNFPLNSYRTNVIVAVVGWFG
jgi:hypothetical protein